MAKYLDQEGLRYMLEQFRAQLAEKAGKEYIDDILGDIDTILDGINGEVV